MEIDYDKANLVQEKVAEKLGVDPNERKIDEFDVMDFMARIENVISELEERAKRLQDDWELDGYRELVFAITKFKQVIADENHHTRHTTRNE